MIGACARVLRRDLTLALRRRSAALNPLAFFVIVTSLFPLGIGPEADLLRAIAPGILWVAALLAAMLSLGAMFEPDHADGTLEQLALSGEPFAALVIAKVCAHWLMTGLPLTLLAPLLALQFHVTAETMAVLCATLLLGTPVLSFVGAVGAALTLGLRTGALLAALLVLPLYIPVLIFGAGGAGAAEAGLSAQPHLMLEGALLLGSLALAPVATAAALRIAME